MIKALNTLKCLYSFRARKKKSTLMACLPTYRHRLPGTNSICAPDRAGQSPSNQKPSHNLNTILNLHKYTVREQQERTRSTRREVWTSGQLQHISRGGSPPAGKQRRAGRSWNELPAQEAEGVGGGPRWASSGQLRATSASRLLACPCCLSYRRLVSGQLRVLVRSPTPVCGEHTSTPWAASLHCVKYSIAFPERDLHLDLRN